MEKNINEKRPISLIVIIGIIIILFVIIYFLITILYEKSLDLENEKIENQTSENINLNDPLFTLNDFPKVDGSTATQPLIKSIMKNFTANDTIDFEKYNFSKTHQAYTKLINDEVDLIVVTSPSEEELQMAKDKGIELEVIPVVREGFVFYVNNENTVKNLTIEQIQKIYTGEITNWKDVGGIDSSIKAYQRPKNSGSQTGMLELVMKDKKIMDAPVEDIPISMSAIINLVSQYDNSNNAIGYSYYYYATTMYQSIDKDVISRIRLLSVNGVEPNVETIKDGSYPFTTSYYIVINKADTTDSPSRKLANYMLSERGQKVALYAGYVPVK